MKVLILTDTHFLIRNGNLSVQSYQSEFFKKQLFPFIEEHKSEIDLIVHGGDVFDQRKYLNYSGLKFWKENFIEPMNAFNIPIHIIIGNHDTYSKSTNNINSPDLLLHSYNNFTVFREVYDNIEANILYVPWVNAENLESTVEAIDKTQSRFCIGHLELAGFQLMPGVTCQHSLLNKNSFVKFEKTLSGHFHIKSSSKGIYYLGCPYQLTWSDYGQKKGFHILDTENGKLAFIENPLEQYIKLEYDDSNSEANLISNIDFTQYQGKFIKLLVKKKTNPYLYTQFLTKLYESDLCQLQITEAEVEYTSKEKIADIKDIPTIMRNNIEGRDFDEELKPKLITYMNSLYEKTLY